MWGVGHRRTSDEGVCVSSRLEDRRWRMGRGGFRHGCGIIRWRGWAELARSRHAHGENGSRQQVARSARRSCESRLGFTNRSGGVLNPAAFACSPCSLIAPAARGGVKSRGTRATRCVPEGHGSVRVLSFLFCEAGNAQFLCAKRSRCQKSGTAERLASCTVHVCFCLGCVCWVYVVKSLESLYYHHPR